MSPPQLTADTPVTDIVRPVEICLIHSFGNQLDFTIFHCLYRRLNQLVHFYKPLLFYQRLNGGLAAVMGSHIVNMVLNFYQKTHSIQFFHNGLSGFITVHTLKLAAVFVDSGVIIHNIDNRKVMTLSYFKVVGVMGGSNLYHTGSEFTVNVSIRYNGNHSVD